MIKVAALTGSERDPAARFRIRQHIKPLDNLGIEVREYIPRIDKNQFIPKFASNINPEYKKTLRAMMLGAKIGSRIPGIIASQKADMTWLGRELIPGRCTLEPLLKKPLILDVDDAIWLASIWQKSSKVSYGKRVAESIAKIARLTDLVIAGNSYLANWFADYVKDVRIIPTAIDTERFKPGVESSSNKFTVGWTGSSGNFIFLKAIEQPLNQFLNRFADTELLIMAERMPSFQSLPNDQVKYIPWSPAMEVKAVQIMDVGLMPLTNNEFTRGKCSFKMLQYLACEKPVIVSPVGMNAEVLSLAEVGFSAEQESDWYDTLVMLYHDRQLSNKYGKTGRKIIETYFSRKIIARKLGDIFKDLA